MKDAFRTACLSAAAFAILLGAAHLRAAAGTIKAAVENPTNNMPPVDVSKVLEAARQSAVDVPSLFLSQEEKIQTVETFVKIVETNSETNDVVSATHGLPRSALRKFVLEKYNPAWLEMWELSVAKRDIRAKWLDLLVVLKNQFPEHASLWASLEKYSNDAVIKDAGWDIMDGVFFTRGDYLEQDAVRDVLKQRLCLLGGREIVCSRREANGPLKIKSWPDAPTNAPFNLIVEIPATRGFEEKRALILDAHMDTIPCWRGYAPEWMDFHVKTREFFHRKEASFGADDRVGVTTILRALEVAKSDYWDRGAGHRRILIIFTVVEEFGCLGTKYLATYYPDLFENVEIVLTNDGPLDYDEPAFYPKDSFIVVADDEMRYAPPYRQIVDCVQEVCDLKHASFSTTTTGLGHGDDAFFPREAHTDLHIRAPYLGNHEKERVKLDDLFNHIDLFTYIILHLDGTPVQIRAP